MSSLVVTRRADADFLPTAEQRVLLKALLAEGDIAGSAAREWLDTIDFERIGDAEIRLMPMLHARLRDLGIEHPLAGRIRGLHRRAWYVDKSMRRNLTRFMTAATKAAPRLALLKGSALGLHVYDEPAHRPFRDFDVLVAEDMQDWLVDALCREGAHVGSYSFHAVTLHLADGSLVDIHRSPYHSAFQKHHVAPLLDRLQPLIASGPAGSDTCEAWWTLGDADHLLHSMLHGLQPSSPAPFRWIVDAALLVRRRRKTLDWRLLVTEAQRLEQVEPAVIGLTEIHKIEPSPEVAAALRQLESMTKASALERWSRNAREGSMIRHWDKTRQNASGMGRVLLLVDFYRRQISLGMPASRVIRRGGPVLLGFAAALLRRCRGVLFRSGADRH